MINLKRIKMHVEAKTKFNYGGILEMSKGDKKEVADNVAEALIKLGYVKKVVISHKNIEEK